MFLAPLLSYLISLSVFFCFLNLFYLVYEKLSLYVFKRTKWAMGKMKKTLMGNPILSTTSKDHLISAISGAFFGFFLFFLIIVIVKTISYWFGIINQFQIEFEDVLLSFIGLVLMALIKTLEGLRLKEPLS